MTCTENKNKILKERNRKNIKIKERNRRLVLRNDIKIKINMMRPSTPGAILIGIFTLLVGFICIRLSICLPTYKNRRKRTLNSSNIKTMVIWGSGQCTVV